MKLLTIKESSQILRISVQRGYELARTGILPVVRLGRQLRVSEEQLREFIENGGKPLPGGWRRQE